MDEIKIIGVTKNCIVCLKPMTCSTGHVKHPDGDVIAGWCDDHSDTDIVSNGKRFQNLAATQGCFGGWLESYGLERR